MATKRKSQPQSHGALTKWFKPVESNETGQDHSTSNKLKDPEPVDVPYEPVVDISSDMSVVPYQPSSRTPQRQELPCGKIANFQHKWYSTYKWLHFIPGTGARKDAVFCFTCRDASRKGFFPATMKTEPAYLEIGFRNWKDANDKFFIHKESDQHKLAEAKLLASKKCNIEKSFEIATAENIKKNREALRAICSSLKYLARQGLPVQGHDDTDGNFMELLRLRSDEVKILQTWFDRTDHYTSHDIRNEILDIMSMSILNDVLSDARKSDFFSLIVDETTDISTKEQLSICVRYVDELLQPQEIFLGLYEMASTTGEAITAAVLDALLRLDLPISKLRGQCYDGGSNMKGKFLGVQARILERQVLAVYVHCLNHSLNLALQDAIRNVPLMRDVLEYVHDVAILFKRSAKRLNLFADVARDLQCEDTTTLKALCPTRWCVRVKSLGAILSNYLVVLHALDTLKESKERCSATASGLLRHFESYDTYFAVMAMHRFFIPCEMLATLLQSESSTLMGSISAARTLVEQLEHMKSEASYKLFKEQVDKKASEFEIDPPVLPRKRKVPEKYKDAICAVNQPDCVDDRFKKIYQDSLTHLIDEINKRFNQPVLHEYSLFENIITDNESLAQPEQIALLKKHGIDLGMLGYQLQMFRREAKIPQNSSITNCIKAFKGMTVDQQKMLNEVDHIIRLLLVIPSSAAKAERSFSMLRRVKTYLRSTMTQKRLNNLCILHTYTELVDKLNLNAVMKEFVERNSRRMSHFGIIEVEDVKSSN